MGAWESGPFDNDSALDWLGAAEGDPSAVADAFSAAETADYLDVDAGSIAVAAAEIVAAAIEGAFARLPRDAQTLAQELAVDDALRASAQRALDAVLGEKSELRSLWTEGQAGEPWRESIMRLRSRVIVRP
jgi:hypothetical protein